MIKRKSTLFFAAIGLLSSFNVVAQGCSDAGFCTVNFVRPNGNANKQSQIKIGTNFGSADKNINTIGSYVEYDAQVNKNFSVDAKLTTLSQSGNSISKFGVADLFLNLNHKLSDNVKLTLGAKLPLGNGNTKNNNLPLPMDYQASLGTFDLLLGVGYNVSGLQFVAALQQPLSQNKNQFLSTAYASTNKLSTFQSTNKYTRMGDFLLRVSYPVKVNDKVKFTPSILPIYHLANDTYMDAANVKRTITGSQGLTFNTNIYFDYSINNKNALQFSLGAPLAVRSKRPDGLTRSFVLNVEYAFKF